MAKFIDLDEILDPPEGGEETPAWRAKRALEADDWSGFESALGEGVDWAERDWLGASWLNRALQYRSLRIADKLMELGADPLDQDETGRDGLLNAWDFGAPEKAALRIFERLEGRAPLGHERASRYALIALALGQEEVFKRALAAGPVRVDELVAVAEIDRQALFKDAGATRERLSALGWAAERGSLAAFEAALMRSEDPFSEPEPEAGALSGALRQDDPAKARALLARARAAGAPALDRVLSHPDWARAPRSRDHAIGLGWMEGEPSERRPSREEAIAAVWAARSVAEALDVGARFLGIERCAWGDGLKGSAQALAFWQGCSFFVAAGERGSAGAYEEGAKAPLGAAATLERSLACAQAMLAALLSPVENDAGPVLAAAGIKGRAAFFKGADPEAELSDEARRRIAYDPFDHTVHREIWELDGDWKALERRAAGEARAAEGGAVAEPARAAEPLAPERIQAFSDRFGLGGVRASAGGGWSRAASFIEQEMETMEAVSQGLGMEPGLMGFGALALAPGMVIYKTAHYMGRVMAEIPVITSSEVMLGEPLAERSRILAHEYGHILDFWSKANPGSAPAKAMGEFKRELAAGPRSDESAKLWAERGWSKALAEAAQSEGVQEPQMASFSAQARAMAERVLAKDAELAQRELRRMERSPLVAAARVMRERLARLEDRPDLNAFRQAANERDKGARSRRSRYESKITEMAARCFETLFGERDTDRVPAGPELDRAQRGIQRVVEACQSHWRSRAQPKSAEDLARARIAERLAWRRGPAGAAAQSPRSAR